MSRTRARCWCGRKFDPTRSLDGVSCHEHDADLTGYPVEPAEPARCGSCGHEAHDAEGCEAWWVVGESTEVACRCRDYVPAGTEPEPIPYRPVEVVSDPWSTPSDEPPPF